jgi:predicted transcriptional regulator
MTVAEKILSVIQEQALSSSEIAQQTEMAKTCVKVALLNLFKRGKVHRERRDRTGTGRGPKSEYAYKCAS